MQQLTITSGHQRVVLQPGEQAVIGRAESCRVVIDDPRVAPEHLRVSSGPQGWILQGAEGSSTWVLGQEISGMVLNHSLEARLGDAHGPSVIFGLPLVIGVPTPAAPPIHHHPVTTEELTSAVAILIPLRSWFRNPGWHQGLRLLVIPYALLPLIFLIVFQNSSNLATPGWAYGLYVAPLWAIAFWYLIRPGPFRWRELAIAVVAIGWTIAWLKIITIWVNDHWFAGSSFWPSIGTGYNEEITKALPVLLIALLLLFRWHRKLDVRMWMYMGTLTGLAFGVYEASQYTSAAIIGINQAQHNSEAITATLLFAFRVFVDGFQHAVWAGISCFFIGLAVNYPVRRVPLILFGVSLAAWLHGLNDWVVGLGTGLSQAGWIALQAVSLILFLGYSMSAHDIEDRLAHDPLFSEQVPGGGADPAASAPPPPAASGTPAMSGATPAPVVPGAPPPPRPSDA